MFKYDIFLSHAAADAVEADGVRDTLIAAKFRVYCDRHDDPQLDRTQVSAATADVLRERMRTSNAMVYVVTANAHSSKWMPWELGFFDGVRGKVLVYPVDEAAVETVHGQEYLRLFTILQPGNLEAQLHDVSERPGRRGDFQDVLRNAFDAAREINQLGMLRDQGMLGPADGAMTDAYRQRMGDAYKMQDFGQILRIQADIWQAWLRIWGIGGK